MPVPVRLWVCVTLLAFAGHANAAEPADARQAQPLATPAGVKFAVWPELPKAPAPTLFILASTAEDTLNQAYYRQAGNALAARGYLCVAVDLPCHGQERRADEPDGLGGWRHRCEQNVDFVADLTGRLTAVLDHLLAENLADPARIAACGTSRGGYSALQFAAADERVKCVAAFAPVTDLTALREFQGAEQNALVQKLTLDQRAGQFAGRAVWIVIGDRDDRVSTDSVIRFAREVTAKTRQQQRPANVDLHVVVEPQGHTTPAGSAEQAAEWIHRQLHPQP